MRPTIAIFFAAVWLGSFRLQPAFAQPAFDTLGGGFATHHTHVSLVLSADPAKPGDTILAGVDLKMDAGWHTYWKNPGDAGSATTITWTLPPGVTAGEIQWPLPQKLPPAEVTTYGYEGETLLIVPLTLGTNLPPGSLNLSAKVSWLECKESCIPADTVVKATLNIGSTASGSADAPLIQTWQGKTPRSDGRFAMSAAWEKATTNDVRPLIITGSQSGTNGLPVASADFFPYASDQFEIQAVTEEKNLPAGFQLRKSVKKLSGDWPTNVSGLVVVEADHQRTGFELQASISDRPPVTGTMPESTISPALPPQSPLRMLLFAFIGGLILNLMPCVLPVIALKILGFVNEANSEPRRVRKLGLVYALGVLASFLVLAGLVISAKAAGHHAGWGMLFGNPVFIVCLATLVTLVALNLFGVFEVTLGGRALDTAGELASQHGTAGAFFNGVLATTLATPCTAPFLAPALGFAFAQSTPVILLFFLTIGLGLATPYVILSWQPGWLKLLPKPGVWMEKFKIAMGFPMLATVVWLFNIAASSYGKKVLWLGIFLVLIAFAAWIFGEFVQRGRNHKVAAGIIALLIAIGSYASVLERELDWRGPLIMTDDTGTTKKPTDGIDWQPWSPASVAAARAAGQPGVVDFTADWCLTCQLNKKTSLEIPSVRAKLKSLNAVALVGDYTHSPEAIATELSHYNRAGVPLVLVFPKNPASPAIVLPELLTPQIVLKALDEQ